ncbi:zinc-dependent alcohol dehydrogenase family protein [Kushneria phosphatilytica]|uniref:Zinc-dependent alcohol dehydrogenase family protein n=1 Tax=Kushneria phosphatilytica TaxID=657387 RepID=A0A1S1NTJ9_9GAMM|nr:zinc-dependent alcohol dehydrogenase family protein [Kushneria phosphatilytica]OHV08800.1 alcohol dehydrogenase [Kushneria phosphatilytica]QEL12520.1 zinc-dependent alcohol dehydrogenase family protein [Kushneria phosphatilytica]
MSRMIRFNRFGPADVLEYTEYTPPRPAADEVLITTEAIGVSWRDVLWRQNLGQTRATLPAGLGTEMAGRILAVGEHVERFSPGDRVASISAFDPNRYSTYGEQIVLPQQSLIRYPDLLTPIEASVHYTPLLSSWLGLSELAELRPGDTVLITAGCQLNGPYAIQMALALGGRVIATTTRETHEAFLRELGAEWVINTETSDLLTAIERITHGAGVNIVLDALGGPQLSLLGEAVAPCGRLVLYDMQGGNQTSFPAQAAFSKNIRFFLHCLSNFAGKPELGIEQNRDALQRAIRAVDRYTLEGRLTPHIDRIFDFDDMVEAHRYLEKHRGPRGRVAVCMS